MNDLVGNISFIHTADWHLGSPKNWGPERIEGSWINRFYFYREQAIRQIIDEASKNKVSAVLVAGDVLDAETLEDRIAERCENFLVDEVIKPLRANKIKLIMTTGGTHDQKKGTTKETESTKLLNRVTKEFPKNAILIVPQEYKLPQFKNHFPLENVLISCDMPEGIKSGKPTWLELCHENKSIYNFNKPLYRAQGHKHIATLDHYNQVYYPGIPFARSSASDNNFTDVGPRYCFLIPPGSSLPKPVQLNVPEAAVLKKKKNYWEFYYLRDQKTQSWRTEEFAYEMDLDELLLKIKLDHPNIGFISFVVNQEEARVAANIYQKLMNILDDKSGEKVIQSGGKENTIITVWLNEL